MPAARAAPADKEPDLIRFEDVTFDYRAHGDSVRALDRVTLSLAPGEVVAALGANGSGKSTLVRLANALLLPATGSVSVDGIDTRDHERTREIREGVGIVFQNPDDQIVATSVEDDIAFGPENLGLSREEIRTRVDAAIDAVGLTGLERREPHLLSGGQKQRLAIAGALAMRPRYLLLDEPTSMLDPAGRAEVLSLMDSLRSAGHGMLLVTHDLAEALRADRAVVLEAGSIVFDGPTRELLGRADDVESWGMESPAIAVMARQLADLGVPVGLDDLRSESLAEALCR